LATLTPAELMIARSHGLRPIATVAATCWWHYGWSWTIGHSEGWMRALQRLKDEAYAAGANAVLDVKMRTIPVGVENSMDFTLVGTAVHVEGLPPSSDPIVATVPALEFVKLLEADVVPTGIAVGAHYEWMQDWGSDSTMRWGGNVESRALSQLWERVRTRAHQDLRANARPQGNGVLAHLNFSQSFETEEDKTRQFLARHIVIATTVDARRGAPFPHEFKMVVDLHAGATPLTGTRPHHESYKSNESEGAI
ncbi:MAG TPA: heavy metal-binding domain-containing protein, partial [Rhizomicrobium sp.]|nr:heavy metal-binding domain-containing protein [Rhizomicrobium sp.]